MSDVRPYGVAIQHAVASGDLRQMKAARDTAESYLKEHGDVSAALQVLRVEIAKLEKKA